jgi:hypothetical protein
MDLERWGYVVRLRLRSIFRGDDVELLAARSSLLAARSSLLAPRDGWGDTRAGYSQNRHMIRIALPAIVASLICCRRNERARPCKS